MAKEVQREGLYDRNSPANRARGRAEDRAVTSAQNQANRRAEGGLHSSAQSKDRKSTKAKEVQREGLYDRNSPANRARGRAEDRAVTSAKNQANRRAEGGLHSSAQSKDRKSTKAKEVQREGLYDRNSPANRARARAEEQAKRDQQNQRKRTKGTAENNAEVERKRRERAEQERREAEKNAADRQAADQQRQADAEARKQEKTPKLPEVPAERGGRDTAESLPPTSLPPTRRDAASGMATVIAATSWASALSQLSALS